LSRGGRCGAASPGRRVSRCRASSRAPQHGTNNAGLKLALWVTVDNTYATKFLAVSLLLDETEESLQFTCECFKDCFRVAPAVIFTDSDPAIKGLARTCASSWSCSVRSDDESAGHVTGALLKV